MSETRAYVIGRPDVPRWVERILERGQVIAPKAAWGSDVIYDVVQSPAEVAWDYSTTFSPLKRFLFPQTDTLLQWERQGGSGLQVSPTYDETERVFLAVRPCDVSGVLYLDRALGGDRPDIYYLKRRARSTLVALACTEPGDHCFCVCAHSGPFLESGYDLQLTPLPGRYLAEVGTAKGAALVEAAAELFSPAPEQAVEARRDLAREAEARFGDERAYFAAALRKLTFDRVPDDLWDEMADRCLSCGGCTFVCPTCSCFSTADAEEQCSEASQTGSRASGCRQRIWDSCSFEAYSLEASGHNPRAARKHRLKARFFHKLSHQFVRRWETHGCVGCGRCVTVCMGGDDMPAVTAKIRRGKEQCSKL